MKSKPNRLRKQKSKKINGEANETAKQGRTNMTRKVKSWALKWCNENDTKKKRGHRKTQKVNGAQKINMQNDPRPRNGMHRGKKSAKDEEVAPGKTCKQANM